MSLRSGERSAEGPAEPTGDGVHGLLDSRAMASSSSGSVLVVDDESSIRESLRMILEYEGYGVREAANGKEALQAVADDLPDAVLLDVKMPEMDGLEVLAGLPREGL